MEIVVQDADPITLISIKKAYNFKYILVRSQPIVKISKEELNDLKINSKLITIDNRNIQEYTDLLYHYFVEFIKFISNVDYNATPKDAGINSDGDLIPSTFYSHKDIAWNSTFEDVFDHITQTILDKYNKNKLMEWNKKSINNAIDVLNKAIRSTYFKLALLVGRDDGNNLNYWYSKLDELFHSTLILSDTNREIGNRIEIEWDYSRYRNIANANTEREREMKKEGKKN